MSERECECLVTVRMLEIGKRAELNGRKRQGMVNQSGKVSSVLENIEPKVSVLHSCLGRSKQTGAEYRNANTRHHSPGKHTKPFTVT